MSLLANGSTGYVPYLTKTTSPPATTAITSIALLGGALALLATSQGRDLHPGGGGARLPICLRVRCPTWCIQR